MGILILKTIDKNLDSEVHFLCKVLILLILHT